MNTSDRIRELSEWLDKQNVGRDPDAWTWERIAKIAEESGEVIQAYIGVTGGNPRKGFYAKTEDVIEELYDTALCALGAVEHLTGNKGDALQGFYGFILGRHKRAGL